MDTYVKWMLIDQLFVCSLQMNNCSLQFSFCESLMLGFSSYDSCSALTHALIHRHLTRMLYAHVCVSFSWVWLFNGILFRNEIAAKCNSIEVCSRRRQIITEYEKNKWINFGFRCFEHTNTHTHKHRGLYKRTLTNTQCCCYCCRILNFHGKTWKLVAYLFIFFLFFERNRRRCHSRRRNNRRQNYNWTNNTPSEAAHADSAAWGVAATAAPLLELEFEYWKMRRHEA